jgi:hypothetical protein
MILSDILAELRNIFSLGEMTTEGRFLYSLIVSLGTFVLFIAITGDLYSGLGFALIIEIILLYVFNVAG